MLFYIEHFLLFLFFLLRIRKKCEESEEGSSYVKRLKSFKIFSLGNDENRENLTLRTRKSVRVIPITLREEIFAGRKFRNIRGFYTKDYCYRTIENH